MDIAELGMDVDSRPLRRSHDEMGRFVAQGRRVEGAARGVERSTDAMGIGLRRAALAAAGVTAAFAATRAALNSSQQYARITNNLRSMGVEASAVAGQIDAIGQIAQRTRSPLEATAQLYQRISIAGKDLGASQQDVLRFTENVGLALAQQGGGAEAASGALLQLSQAMAGGVVRAEEFNSVLENAYPIAQAAANAIDGTGGSVGRLRNMVIEGEISSREFFNAILSSSTALEAAFANTAPTISQAMSVLGTSFTLFVGSMDKAAGASALVAEGIIFLADNLQLGVTIAGTAAVAFGTRYVAAIVLANTHTLTLAGSMKVLSAALVRTGIGALIVGAGVLVDFMIRLSSSTAKWADVLDGVFEVGKEVFLGVGNTAWGLSEILAGVASAITGSFVRAFAEIAKSWDALMNGMATAWNSIAGTAFGETLGLGALGQSNVSGTLGSVADSLFDQAVESIETGGARIKAAGEGVQTAISDLNSTVNSGIDVNSEATEEARRLAEGLEGVGGAAGGAGKAAKGAGKAAKDLGEELPVSEAEAFEKAMADAAYTAEDFGKAKAQAVIRGVEGISDAWGDFVVNGFRDFKGFANSILDSFKNLIAQMVATAARNRILFSMGVTGSVAGTAAGAAGGVGGVAGGGGILGNVLGGGGLLGNLLGGTGGLLGGVMGGAQAALGLGGFSSAGIFNIGANAAVASAATGAGSLASTIGAALPAVGLVAGGIALISSFFKTTTKLLNEGLRVEVEDSVTSIRQFQDIQKKKYWGLSKSNSRNFSEVPEEFQRAWDNTLSGITGALGNAAEQLGLAGENFLSVWDGYNMDISTKGLSEDEIQQKVSEFFQQYASDIVAYGLDKSGVGMFAVIRDEVLREGEELSDGFIRMGNAISVANRNLRDLNVALFDISVQGGVYAAQFADMFGGVENMQAAMNGYIQAMFSEQGQLIVRQRRLVEALSAVGVGLPATSEAYREMVEAQDLTTERGREVAATLIQLSGEFAALEDALGSLGYTVAGLSTAVIEATFSAEDALEEARARAVQEYQNVMRMFGEQIRAAEQAAAEIRRVFDILDDALASRGLLSERAEMMRRETALNELRAGINDPDRLRDVVRTLNAPSEQYFGNAIDYARDFAITSGAMAAQRDIAKEQLTEAEQQIVLLEEQRDAIEDQYAEILGINEGVFTLNEAIAQLDLTMQEVRDATMRVEQAMLSLANSMLGAISGIAGAGGAAGLGMAGIDQFDENRTNAILSDAATSTFTGVAETINRLYRDTLGRNVDAAGLEFYGGLLQSGQANAARIGFELATSQEAQSGVTPGFGEIGSAQPVNTIDALYSSMLGREADAAGRAFWESTGLQGEDLINAFRDGAIANGDTPAFAMGGMHAGGLRIVGENGPELEATGPSRIYSARQTREIMQPGTTLGAEMRQLIEYTRQLVKINNKQERALREIELQGETA